MYSSSRTPPPQVTGISPKEGPPGTRVTIRGENLGVDSRDLMSLRICGIDCMLSAEWKSPNKIVARTGQAKGKGDIIVTTRSGGVGTCTVQFKCYHVTTGPLQDSAIWVDESQMINSIIGRNRVSSPLTSQDHDDPLGISDESNDLASFGSQAYDAPDGLALRNMLEMEDSQYLLDLQQCTTRFPEEELVEMFPEGSGSTSTENFVPQWFLLENHHGTSFDDLKAGLAYLKRKRGTQHEGPLAFVKANLTTFMDCQDTLAEMHQMLVNDQNNSRTGSCTESLEDVLVRSNKSADTLFKDVLRRKDRADATRNALGVLQRFKFLFNLPCNIDRNVKRGDYDLVITDYTRVKSLFGDTDIKVFKKIYQEVENRIEAFRDMLTKKLLTLPSSLEEQKRLIRYLVHLETPGDPAWQCLTNMQQWLVQLLNACKEENIKKAREDLKEKPDEHPGIQSPSKSGSKSGSRAPQKVQFVDQMTRVLSDHLPDLWRLGQAYFSGKLHKDVKDKASKIDASKQTHFKEMIQAVIELFCNLIRAAFLPSSPSLSTLPDAVRAKFGLWPDNKQDSPTAWLPMCVRNVRSCVSSLVTLDLDQQSLELLQNLAFDMRTTCMSTLFNQAIQDIENLHERETWHVEADDERGGTTLLPALFENVVSEMVQYLQDVIQSKPGEKQIFSDQPVQKTTTAHCTKLLQSFAKTMEQLAMIGNKDKNPKRKRSTLSPDSPSSPGFADALPSLDRRLMVMLSNCHHTYAVILPRLIDNLSKHSYPDMENVYQVAKQAYIGLDETLFQHYVEEKSNPVVGALEHHMYAGQFDWNACYGCQGVRRYVKEALMGMIEVHAEVYSINPKVVHRVMIHVVGGVVDEMCRLVQCVPSFNQHGKLQAHLDLTALQIAVEQYKSQDTIQAFSEASDYLDSSGGRVNKRDLDELLSKFRNQMRFQLACFRTEQTSPHSAAA